jgi:mono/diheme cytochrome c family protein
VRRGASRHRRRLAIWPVLALVVGAAPALAWWVWPSSGGPLASADDPRQLALGQQVYREHCAACHGADLEGEPDWETRRPDGRMPAPPHDDSGHTWHHDDDMLFEIVKHGLEPFVAPGYQSDMPAFAGILSDAEIRAVLAFIKSHWGPRERAFQEEVSSAAREAKQ